jgi:sulfopyruvate decarboxylase subunit alpha
VSLPATIAPAWASGVCAGVHAAGSRHVLYVPDNPLSHVVRTFERQYNDVRLVVATREEEAFGIAAGLYLAGARPTVMLQSSGLGNSLNAISSLMLPYQIPVLMIISMRGDASEWNAAQVPMGRAVTAILESIGIPHLNLDAAASTEGAVRVAGLTAFATRTAGACLLARRMTSGSA